uniref:Uncharacterized protein n=1 Tax=Ceratitis capitata TaxID=7213 RepID=W8AVK3_CERCA
MQYLSKSLKIFILKKFEKCLPNVTLVQKFKGSASSLEFLQKSLSTKLSLSMYMYSSRCSVSKHIIVNKFYPLSDSSFFYSTSVTLSPLSWNNSSCNFQLSFITVVY